MQKTDVSLIITLVVLVLVIGGVAVVLMPKGNDGYTPAESVVLPRSQFAGVIRVVKTPDGQEYLADSKGIALYFSTQDKIGTIDQPPKSNCTGDCVKSWPAYFSRRVIAPANLSNGDFISFQREDGKRQTAFRGWPLYYFNSDFKQGDFKGEGLDNIWFTAKPSF